MVAINRYTTGSYIFDGVGNTGTSGPAVSYQRVPMGTGIPAWPCMMSQHGLLSLFLPSSFFLCYGAGVVALRTCIVPFIVRQCPGNVQTYG